MLVERRVAARGGDPLLNLGVLRAPALPSGLATLAATQVGYGGLLFTFTLHLQAELGQSPLRTGLSYLPIAATFGPVRCSGWPGARRSGYSHWTQGDRRARGGGGRINSGIVKAMSVMM